MQGVIASACQIEAHNIAYWNVNLIYKTTHTVDVALVIVVAVCYIIGIVVLTVLVGHFRHFLWRVIVIKIGVIPSSLVVLE